ncbi:MAG: radical SAM family heme chaperone HemW [Gammaproteobacteria bacterium]|nr:radical SAM family heme chaperone HemW [Gammaproteobacteria bacterium]
MPPVITRQLDVLPPLSLYIHIPWCIKKCPYCDFNSHAAGDSIPEEQYIDALIRDINAELPHIWGRRISSIFFGGGTPSLFSASALDRLLSHIRAVLPCLPAMEITLEANPGTFEQQKFSDYRQIGINRLSVGIQSFNDQHLKSLGRVHSGAEARRAVDMLQQAGFDNFNLDLMYALPAQTTQAVISDLEMALALKPTHLSHYQLTIEPNTFFHTHVPDKLPENDLIWEMQHESQQRLEDAGFLQYEVSAYAKPGQQSQHNMNYWHFGDYLGIGAGAHGKISRADNNQIYRVSKLRQPKAYMQHAGTATAISEQHELTSEQIDFEFMLNALRLKAGFASSLYQQHTGQSLSTIDEKLNLAVSKGLLDVTGQHIKPSEQGFLFLNDLLLIFLTDDTGE